MPKAKRCVADVVFQLWTFQVAGNDLSADKRTKSLGVTYLPTKFYTCESALPIIWVTEIIRFNLNGIGGIGTCKAYTTTTLRLNDIADQDPTSPREAKSCCVPSAKHSRQNLEVGATETGHTLPVYDRFRRGAGWQRVRALPETTNAGMVLKSGSDSR